MKVHGKIFVEAKTKYKAEKVVLKLGNLMSIKISEGGIRDYHKGGFVASFNSLITEENWAEAILFTLQEAQNIGDNWILTGDITEELDAWSNNSKISGITSMQLILERP